MTTTSRRRRSLDEARAVFRPRTPEQQRQANVQQAMADGSFAKTRFAYNKANPKHEMDAAGNIRAKSREENIATAKADGSFDAKVTAYNKANPDKPMNTQTGAFEQPKVPAKPQPVAAMPRKGGSMIDGKPAREWFQEAANRQGERNQYAKPQTPDTIQGPPKSAKPGLQTVGDMMAEIDKASAKGKAEAAKLRAMFPPRSPATAEAPKAATPTAAAPDAAQKPQPTASTPPTPAPAKPTPAPSNVANHFSGSPVGEAVSDAARDVKAGVKAYGRFWKSAANTAGDTAVKMMQPAIRGITNSPNFQGSIADKWMKSRRPQVAAQ